MSILTAKLPDSVEIDGKQYPVYTDFRNWVEFEALMMDGSRSLADKIVSAFALCYHRDALPPDFEQAASAMVWFYCGETRKNSGTGGKKQKAVYSFEHDADYIYSAFLAQYGIDLQTANLHWWQFKALFKSLGEENKICKIMEYRAIDLAKIKDKEQKAFYRKMKAHYRLPDMRSEEEKEADMLDALASAF